MYCLKCSFLRCLVVLAPKGIFLQPCPIAQQSLKHIIHIFPALCTSQNVDEIRLSRLSVGQHCNCKKFTCFLITCQMHKRGYAIRPMKTWKATGSILARQFPKTLNQAVKTGPVLFFRYLTQQNFKNIGQDACF